MGTRLRVAGCHCRSWDHPHAYGDKQMLYTGCYTVAGSSPRVWGQVTIHLNSFGCRGIIPTRMGTSKSSAQCFPCLWDHPHAYGDKRISLDSFIVRAGSSPRVWGQVPQLSKLTPSLGIIPTRMGTRIRLKRQDLPTQDHPHAYGDKFIGSRRRSAYNGSSPRVWGQVLFSCVILIL